jgi:SAM-dependent methyltransferase
MDPEIPRTSGVLMDPTIQYYNEHAEEFRNQTINAPMDHLYAPFLAHIRASGRILDAGCGVGRDSKAFLDRGYQVVSFDASDRMTALTTQLTGQPVLHLRFEDVDFRDEFDGVWACASLLHVRRSEIEPALRRLIRAVKPGGIVYASFKLGDGERTREGRLFNDYNEPAFRTLLSRMPEQECVDCWQTQDVRPERVGETWLNALLRKLSPGIDSH